MEKHELEYFRKLLGDWLSELEQRAGSTVNELKNSFEYSPDLLDRASFDTDRNFTLRIRNRERNLVNKIRQALEAIEDGEYGICEVCGEEISIPRLKARPVTTHCIECKTKMEAQEQQRMAIASF